jgi:hypothetical protein
MKCIKQILNLTSTEKNVSFYYLKLLKLAVKAHCSNNIARSNNIAPTVALCTFMCRFCHGCPRWGGLPVCPCAFMLLISSILLLFIRSALTETNWYQP